MPKRAFYYAEKTDDTWTDRGVWNKALSGEQYDVGNGAFNADTSLFTSPSAPEIGKER